MAKKKKPICFRIVMITLTATMIAYAFTNSLMSGDISDKESTFVVQILNDFFGFFGVSASLTNHIVRKAAHFTEYSLIGLMMMNTAYSFNKSRPQKYYMTILFSGLFTAVIDETIQLGIGGRSGQLSDVLLDFSAVVLGSIIMLLVLTMYKKIRKIR